MPIDRVMWLHEQAADWQNFKSGRPGVTDRTTLT